ncbi:phosphoglycerate kinase [candidate division KSB1 bacterium]|nr:phosphoglycerate kinase [candidate division KSB1 bacterium]
MINRPMGVDHLNFKGKRVLIRVDFNVPLDEGLNITDDTRIVEALPTIRKVLADGGKAILMSHLGRPKGQVKPELSLVPVAKRLSEMLDKQVMLAEDCIGAKVESLIKGLKAGDCLLLENLRFHPEEEKNAPDFSRQLASLGDIYINDAFGSAHRSHASTVGVTRYYDQCAAGYLMQKEIAYLGKALSNPERPFVAILGGAKVSGKIDVIKNLLDKVDYLLIGGGMAYTFFRAMGLQTGESLVEEDKIGLAAEILGGIKDQRIDFILPDDCVVAEDFSNEASYKTVPRGEIPPEWQGLDVGPKTVERFALIIGEARTVLWNGPLGVFEMPNFAMGTRRIAQALANVTDQGAVTIIGGGDTAAAVKQFGFGDRISHISTGGGASLEFLEGKKLPGIEALTDA